MFFKPFYLVKNKLANVIVNFRLKLMNEVKIGDKCNFIGIPIIIKIKNTNLIIGNNVTINSDKLGYHLNMHSPCKLYLDRVGGKIVIGDNTRINGACIHAYESIEIGKNCLIAANTQIMDGNGHDLSFNDVSNRIKTHGTVKPVVIEDNVWIGANSIILPGVTIGYGSVISANSVINMNIPPMCIAGGNPAKVLKQY
jgi:acetyltransferase-like isoleucine patch superfamily enzyme